MRTVKILEKTTDNLYNIDVFNAVGQGERFMKKLFCCMVLGALAVACASSQDQDYSVRRNTAGGTYTKYQIVDQEFDNFSVKNDGYDRVAPYEEQIVTSSYIQSTAGRGTQKPARMMEKTVVNAQGQILSPSAAAPVMDSEVLPDDSAAK